MQISLCRFYPYQNQLTHSGAMRQGIIIELTDVSGCSAWGECAPLADWSQETFNEAFDQLRRAGRQLVGQHIDPLEISTDQFYPSVAFGMQSATRGLQKVKDDPFQVALCPLLIGSFDQIMQKKDLLVSLGHRCAKLKLADMDLFEATELIHELKKLFSLRIDLNRKWNLKKASNFFSHFSPGDFDYIEEPVDCPEDLQHFEYPFALDESLREYSARRFLHLKNLKAFIFKPTLQGGLSEVLKLKSLGKPIVFSSAFESGIGIYQIARLANISGCLNLPLGLDTYRYLTNDFLSVPFDFSKPLVLFPSLIQPNLEGLDDRNDVSHCISV